MEPSYPINAAPAGDTRSLEEAFRAFNRFSRELADSYRDLESQVERLNRELSAERDNRLHHLAEQERLAGRLRRLLDALPAGVVVLDGSGRVQQSNPAALDLLGAPLDGCSWRKVIARAFEDHSAAADVLKLRDGRLVSLTTCPLGKEPGQILLLQDVTAARALQERLNRHQRLSAMGETAARLAHQLRTPLASAMLYVSHLGRAGSGPDDTAALAGKIMGRLRHLERQVRDMLVFARGGRPGGERIEIAQLLNEQEQALAPLLAGGAWWLELVDDSGGAVLRGNREALTGALQNLLHNAMQAGGRGGNLRLAACRRGGSVELSVSDDGPGIPPEIQQRVFEPFFTTREQGTGLGLAVVQAVARAHGGEAGLHSIPGRGCCVRLELPLAGAALSDPEAGCVGILGNEQVDGDAA